MMGTDPFFMDRDRDRRSVIVILPITVYSIYRTLYILYICVTHCVYIYIYTSGYEI